MARRWRSMIFVMNCTSGFAFYRILLTAFFGWYTEFNAQYLRLSNVISPPDTTGLTNDNYNECWFRTTFATFTKLDKLSFRKIYFTFSISKTRNIYVIL